MRPKKAIFYQSYDGILQGNCNQKGWIDLTTSSPTLMRNLAKEFESLGGLPVDAPVTGSLDAAIRGDMIMFVGGTDKAIKNVKEVYWSLPRRYKWVKRPFQKILRF